MFDFRIALPGSVRSGGLIADKAELSAAQKRYLVMKRAFDLFLSIPLLIVFAFFAVVLLALNPFFNAGPLFYVQRRMGKGCEPFMAYKFRSMVPVKQVSRGAFDPLDSDRITPLGRIIRKTRIDELPQVLNVLFGDMSLIGPRPDSYDHAVIYVATIPGYEARCQVQPGISGYAQIKVGYVDGRDGVIKKVRADMAYIRNASFSFDLLIAWRTLYTILTRQGS
jgi:lipopolysaccharide/colanic/teichoic acid biosynthesis glycosyltransferase